MAKVYDVDIINSQRPSGLQPYRTWTEIVLERVQGFKKVRGSLAKFILTQANNAGLGYSSESESYQQYNEKLFREIIIEAQTHQHSEKGSLFYLICTGEFDELRALLFSIEAGCKADNIDLKNSEIYRHDAAGANIVHIAYLFKQYEIGHYLVQRYPRLALRPYINEISSNLLAENDTLRNKLNRKRYKINDMMPYTGENILHIAIIRRNFEEVRWILDFYRDHKHSFKSGLAALLNSNADGKFFDPKGSFYFGGFPLQFAVCSNNTDIFDLVYSFASTTDALDEGNNGDTVRANSVASSATLVGPSVIFARDSVGNTVLHLCVLHGLTDMYKHVYKTAVDVVSRELRKHYAKYSADDKCPPGTVISNLEQLESEDDHCPRGYVLFPKVVRIPKREKLEEWVKQEAELKVQERLVLALNEDFHSPLTLAASIIRKDKDTAEMTQRRVDMFQFLLSHSKQPLWTYGPVSMALLDLEGVEIKHRLLERYQLNGRERIARQAVLHTAIDWLCINDADIAIQIPEIRRLIETKWERVGYPFFLLSFVINAFTTVMVTLILIFINATPTVKSSYSTEIIVDILYPIVAVAFFIMFCKECFDLIYYHSMFMIRGVAKVDKYLRAIKVVTFVIFCCFKAAEASSGGTNEEFTRDGATVVYSYHEDQGVKVSLAICVIACWLHLYYYLMGFDKTGPFVLTIFRIISNDIPFFLNFYSVVVVAFACALSLLANIGDNEPGYGFFLLLQSIWTLMQITVNFSPTHDVITYPDSFAVNLQWLAEILYTLYYTSVGILMINLLIAMIGNTYTNYSSYNEALLLIAKYNIMHAAETVMNPDEISEGRAKYTQVNNNLKVESQMGRIVPPVGVSPAASKVALTTNKLQETENDANNNNLNVKPKALSDQQQFGSSSNIVCRRGEIGRCEEITVTRYLFEMQTIQEEWWSSEQINLDSIYGSSNDLSNRKTTLFIIDPQIDFHDEGGEVGTDMYHSQGSLWVPGANEDSDRIAKMIDDYGAHIHDIFVSMDSHYSCHIAHAVSWVDVNGQHPKPYTTISNEDVVNKVWRHLDDTPGIGQKFSMQQWVRHYTSVLERKSRMKLTIWPEHCIVGSRGHSVVPVINAALQRWAAQSKRTVQYVMKGQNLRTEMYSALEAEVEDPLDNNTALNNELVSMLKTSDRLLLCGQAMSHCVNYTTRDIMDHWGGDLSDLVLLTDGASPVAGFTREAVEFQKYAAEKGVTMSTTTKAFEGYSLGPTFIAKKATTLDASDTGKDTELQAEEAKSPDMTMEDVSTSSLGSRNNDKKKNI